MRKIKGYITAVTMIAVLAIVPAAAQTSDSCTDTSTDLGGIIIAGITAVASYSTGGIIIAGATQETCGIIIAG